MIAVNDVPALERAMNWSVRRLRRKWTRAVETDDIRSAVHEAAVFLLRRDGEGFQVSHLLNVADRHVAYRWRWARWKCRDVARTRRLGDRDFPVERAEADERVEYLRSAVAELSEFDRQVVERFEEPRPVTAAALSVSVNQLRHRRRVLMEGLRKAMPHSLFE